MSLLRRPPTKILLTAEEVRHSLEQAAKEEELRNLENERLRQIEDHKQKQLQAVQQQQQAAESKKSTRTRSRDDRIGVGSSRATGGTGSGRMTEHTRNAR
ncbi:hypothetical protein TWF718_008063 [Orbilia javanica]|uniref:Uncharacterized protein n=1 Tax=Orbilia javanica TaxID=47235 RepID=A0AAN8MW96_9PEZI